MGADIEILCGRVEDKRFRDEARRTKPTLWMVLLLVMMVVALRARFCSLAVRLCRLKSG